VSKGECNISFLWLFVKAGLYLPFCCHQLHVSVLAGTPSSDEFTVVSDADLAHLGDRSMFEIAGECCTNEPWSQKGIA